MLVIDPSRVFWAGLGVLAVALASDSAIHLAGWVAAEQPVHGTILLGMLVALAGVFMRAMGPTVGKETAHAHR